MFRYEAPILNVFLVILYLSVWKHNKYFNEN